jgi:predicted ferric reductase
MGALLAVCYVLALVLPFALAALAAPVEAENLRTELGKGLALAAATILFLQVVLAGRFRAFSRHFGLDILVRFHRNMAVLALVMLLLHPVFIAWGGGHWDLLYSLDVPWYILMGKAALVLLLLNGVLSLFQRRIGLSFEGWRGAHDVIGPLLLVAAFTHSIVVGDDLHWTPLGALWVLLLAMAVALFAWHRLLRPRMLARHPWTVTAVEEEADGVHTLRLAPPEGEERYRYLPGQFHFLTLKRGRDLAEEEHHFTISSSPTQGREVTSTIKNLGDFTSTIGLTRPGDKAVVQGPFGRFSYVLHPGDKDLVFVAGGIGITPLMSMLRHMRDTGATIPVTLFHANANQAEMVFRKELEAMHGGNAPQLGYVPVLSHPGEGWQGETGHIDADMVRRHCGDDLAGKTFYLCGPPGLVAALKKALAGLDVPDSRMRLEIFSFLD